MWFTVHVTLTTIELGLVTLARSVHSMERLFETVKCDLADGLCRRFDMICEERCSHLERYARQHALAT